MKFNFEISLGEISVPEVKAVLKDCYIRIESNMTHEELKLQFDKLPSFVHNNMKLMSFMDQLGKDQVTTKKAK